MMASMSVTTVPTMSPSEPETTTTSETPELLKCCDQNQLFNTSTLRCGGHSEVSQS